MKTRMAKKSGKKSVRELDSLPGYREWIEVVKTYTKCQRLLSQELEALDLSVAKHEVLLAVAREEGLSQQQLSRRLLVAKSNVTALLQRLVVLGLVRREPNPDDARGRRVYLTDAGRRLMRRAARRQAKVVRLMTECVSAQEVALLGGIMKTVGGALDEALGVTSSERRPAPAE